MHLDFPSISYNSWLTFKKSMLTHYFVSDMTHTQELKVTVIVIYQAHVETRFIVLHSYIYSS